MATSSCLGSEGRAGLWEASGIVGVPETFLLCERRGAGRAVFAPSSASVEFARADAGHKAWAGMREVRCSKTLGTGVDGWSRDCFSFMLCRLQFAAAFCT